MDIEIRDFDDSDYIEFVGMVNSLYSEDPEGQPMNSPKVEATINEFKKNPEKIRIVTLEKIMQVLLSMDVKSREEVDEMAKNVIKAGGAIFGEPAEHHGWMYGCGFADLDEHRWNVLYMDMNKLPKK